jgi:hypothetical protein
MNSKNNEKIFDVVVIGAGPAGMIAAISAATSGSSTILLEKNSRIGKKLLATGNGRCNITNRLIEISKYYGDPEFAINIINMFDQEKTISFFESLGLLLKEEDSGRIFPRTNQASSVVNILAGELAAKKVQIKTDTEVREIAHTKNIFNIKTAKGIIIKGNKLIITTGGKAAHQFGSSGDGLFWSKIMKHNITPIYAALVPIETAENWTKDLQGLKVKAMVKALKNSETIAEKFGDVLFTHYGLSGPAIMSMSRHIAPFIETDEITLCIDLFPNESLDRIDDLLENTFRINNTKSVKNALIGILPQKLIPILLKLSSINEFTKSAEISKKARNNLILNIKSLKVNVSKIRPLKEAQVTSGGVCTNEINNETLESKIVDNLFFAGEIINVDADSGGFNLQWCWSSGFIAGKSAAKDINYFNKH